MRYINLSTDPSMWLEDQFNKLYDFADKGQEINSPLVSSIQSAFSDASKLLAAEYGTFNPELVASTSDEFQTRLHLIFMRSMAESGNLEAMAGLASKVRGEGFFNTFSYENGQVGRVYARMLESYDDFRLAHGGKNFKMTPELEAKFMKMLEEEEYKIAKLGIGHYGGVYKRIERKVKSDSENKVTPRQKVILREDEFVQDLIKRVEHDAEGSPTGVRFNFDIPEGLSPEEAEKFQELKERAVGEEIRRKTVREITRSVRAANDLFQISQRHALINSRGLAKEIDKNKGAMEYLGQPGGELSMFNPEAFIWLQYSVENIHDDELIKQQKLDMAISDLKRRKKDGEDGIDLTEWNEERLMEYGTVLFRDMIAVADFYSSGWRIEGTLEHLDEYAKKKASIGKKFDAGDFALFMRLKDLGPSHKKLVKK